MLPEEMRISKFVVEHPFAWEGKEGCILFHTLNRGLKLVDAEVWRGLRAVRVEESHRGLGEELFRDHFLVSRDLDESRVLATWRSGRYFDTRHLAFKVKLTEDCNLGCDFCIQEGVKRPVSMSELVARQSVRFIQERISEAGAESAGLVFTGGEPLLNRKALKVFEGVRHFCAGLGARLDMSVVTNGTLLNRAAARELRDLGISTVRVSLFGPREVHDRHRPFKNGSGSFRSIEENLQEVSDILRFRIACQYDETREDYRSFPELFLRFRELGLDRVVEDMEFAPLVPREHDFDRRKALCGSFSRPEVFFFLEEEARVLGLKRLSEFPINECMANYRGRYVIDADGSLLSCPAFSAAVHGKWVYGNVFSGVDFVRESQIMAPPQTDSCMDCSLAPLCDGGCRQQSLVKGDGFHGIDCHREYLMAILLKHLELRVAGFLQENREVTQVPRAA